MTKKKIKIKFEDQINRLEEISELLEGDTIGLDEAISLYEEGILLSKECYSALKNAELKITELKKQIGVIPSVDESLFEE